MDLNMDQMGDNVSGDSLKTVMNYLFDIDKKDKSMKLQLAFKDKEIEDLKKQISSLSNTPSSAGTHGTSLVSAPFSKEELKKELSEFLYESVKETIEHYFSNIDAVNKRDIMECMKKIETLTEQFYQMENHIFVLKEQIPEPNAIPSFILERGLLHETTESEEENEQPLSVEDQSRSIYLSASLQNIEESGNQSSEDFINEQIFDGPPEISPHDDGIDCYSSKGNNQDNEGQQLNDQALNGIEIESPNVSPQQEIPTNITRDILNQIEPVEERLSDSLPTKRRRHGQCPRKPKKVVLPILLPKEETEDGTVELSLEIDPDEQSTSGTGQNNQTDGMQTCEYQTVSGNQTSSQMSYEDSNYSMNVPPSHALYRSGNLFRQVLPNMNQCRRQMGLLRSISTCMPVQSPVVFPNSSNQISPGQDFYRNPPATSASIQFIAAPPTTTTQHLANPYASLYLVNTNVHAHQSINQAGQLPLSYNRDLNQQ